MGSFNVFQLMKFIPCVAFFSLVVSIASAKPEAASGDAILTKVLRTPGLYNQICDAVEVKLPIPMTLTTPWVSGEAELSKASRKLVNTNRAALIPALKKQLAAIDFAKKPAKQKPDPKPSEDSDVEGVGVDPKAFSNVLLDVVRELKAVEILPELLAVEAKLFAGLTEAEKNPKAAIPKVDGADGAGIYMKAPPELDEDSDKWTPEQKANWERTNELVRVSGLHRDLLMLIYNLMREKKFGPLLASNLEKIYLVELQRLAAEDDILKKAKSLEEVPEEERESVKVDPINGVLFRDYPPVQLEFSIPAREEIIAIAAEFTKQTAK